MSGCKVAGEPLGKKARCKYTMEVTAICRLYTEVEVYTLSVQIQVFANNKVYNQF